MIHTHLPRNCVVFLLLCELTRSAIYGSQKFDSHKWPTVLVDEVKGKPCNLEACLCGSLISTFTTSFYPYAFWLQTLFKDQLDRSKATCSFNVFYHVFETIIVTYYEGLIMCYWFRFGIRTAPGLRTT